MAVTNTRVDSDLVLTMKIGTKASGEDEVKNFRFTKVRTEVEDEALYAVGAKMAELIPYPLKSVQRTNDSVLVQA